MGKWTEKQVRILACVPAIVIILIIHEVVTNKKDKNMDPNVSQVSPKDWAENRNEEKDVDN